MRHALRLVLCLSLLVVSISVSVAQERVRDPAQEAPYLEELRRTAPGQVDNFVTATAALDTGNYQEAERLYNEVLKAAPDFEPAIRRLGYVSISLGKRKEGLDLTQKALAKNRSVENLVGRASALLTSPDLQFRPSPAEINEASALAGEAWQKSGETDEGAAGTKAETLLRTDKIEEFERFVPVMKRKFPESPTAAYYNAIALANQGSFDEAEAEMKLGESLGAPAESFAGLRNAIAQAQNESYFGLGRYRQYFWYLLYFMAAWIVGLLVLFIAGRLLSAKTLRSIETSDPNDIRGGAQAGLKDIYKKVITLAGIFYYLSQPFVILLIIGATGAIVFFFLWVGQIPIKLLAILVIVGLAGIFYMIKSLFIRVKPEDPGRALSEAEAPGLWELVRNVAKEMNTRPVDEIRITHGTDLAVYERGGFRAKVTDSAERILIIGAAVLNDFDQNAFRAVLAHEYGHFSNRDTAGGEIAFRVNNDIVQAANSMAISGTATFYNLGFQFLRLYHFLFRRVTHGATRLQEILADRVAAYLYGAEAFRDGLNHVIRRELEFGHVADREINAAFGANRALQNLYDMQVQDESALSELDAQFAATVSRATTDDDTHPSPADRFKYIEGIRSRPAEPLQGVVWDLFADKAVITSEMNSVIEDLVRQSA